MQIATLTDDDLHRRLNGPGLILDVGAASIRVFSDTPDLGAAIRTVYGAFPVLDADRFCEVAARVRRVGGLRRLVRPQVEFEVDGLLPFEPFPADTPLPLLEWGVNWTLAERFNHRLLLHAGVVEKSGVGIVMPAIPGSGKSTLTAALMLSGYRLLSDEFGAVHLDDGSLLPVLKGAALKNASIDVIHKAFPAARFGPSYPGTRKGTVAHLAPDAASVAARHQSVQGRLIIFPLYQADAEIKLEPVGQAEAFAKLVVNAFNYELLGPAGFTAASRLVRGCTCYRLTYARLGDAIAETDRLVLETAEG
ncbi:MAG: HprK-related kinase A [Burkholderiales bacterium]|nr:HprK-related kinase A [Burkholderiales bacterium]